MTRRRGDLVQRPAGNRRVPSTTRRPSTSAPLLADGHEALHLANRLAFGPTPQLVGEIVELGGRDWIDQQLEPASIDDRPAEALVAEAFPETSWSAPELHASDDIEHWQCPYVLRLATLARAVHSRRQLFEVMVWFWNNHLTVYPAGRWSEIGRLVEDRDVMRRHALGRFEDLLMGSAKSPAMLSYLDNDDSRAPDVNENYARELLELHTLGVDGGYTEVDVRNAAGVLAGWTIDRDTGEFAFRADWQDDRAVRVLGLDVPAGRSLARGEALVRHLARHPSTATFLATKLVRFLVDEDPPARVVAAAADAYLRSGTDITATLRAIFDSSEFWTSAGGKVHQPFFAFAKALRATRCRLNLDEGRRSESAWQLMQRMEMVGQTPSGWKPPNGYPDADAYWTGPGLLIHRWNMHSRLATNRLWHTRVDVDALLAGATTAREAVDHLCAELTCRRPTTPERAVLEAWLGDLDQPLAEMSADVVQHLVALVLSLPDAQRR